MIDVIKSLFVGAVVGAVFGLAGLPVPAPVQLAGLAGIAGLMIGYAIIRR